MLLIGGIVMMLAASMTAGLGLISWISVTSVAAASEGQRLFDHETFGGNGRTCRSCHSGDDGTIDPAEVADAPRGGRVDPLFVHDGLDDFFNGTSRIVEHATILIDARPARRRRPPGRSVGDLGCSRAWRAQHGEHARARSGADV